ncbi:MAG: DegT/DnrJ/EryC1/StrS family aminotransferase [Thermoleophilia bacterium]|nr:DegT/DnrJ/EryC1/StrS family aminotransferase [Thermoleophilia bacterium]
MAERIRFPFARPVMPAPAEWVPLLDASYSARWYSNGGPLVTRLERELGEPFEGREAVLVGSATAGITAALLAMGVRGRVVVPAFTFPATIHAIELAGCEPLLCDIDPETWELAPHAAQAAVATQGCIAIVHVRAYGLCRDLSAMEHVAREAGVPLIVDSAAAFGGTEPTGRLVGHAGDAEVFSFHATKVFAMGEGGAVIASPELVTKMGSVINFCIDGGDVTGRAMNGKVSEFAAAVAIAASQTLASHIGVREAAQEYLRVIAERAGARAPASAHVGQPPWQCLPLVLHEQAQRDGVKAHLRASGIESRAYYCPGLHRSTAWAGRASGKLPATDWLAARLLCIPLYSDLAGAELREVGVALRAALAAHDLRHASDQAA